MAPRWFGVTEVRDGVFRITEPHVHAYVRSNAWLKQGTGSHLLVDAGLGIGRLPDELAEHLDRPVIAVATHAHFDHFGGLAEFSDRAAHGDDGEVIEQAADYVTLTAGTYPAALLDEFEAGSAEPVPELLIDALPYDGFDLMSFRTPPAAITRWLADGDVLDLGGRSFEVLHAPGHSPRQHLPPGSRIRHADLRRRHRRRRGTCSMSCPGPARRISPGACGGSGIFRPRRSWPATVPSSAAAGPRRSSPIT